MAPKKYLLWLESTGMVANRLCESPDLGAFALQFRYEDAGAGEICSAGVAGMWPSRHGSVFGNQLLGVPPSAWMFSIR